MPKFFKTKFAFFLLILIFLLTGGLSCKTTSQELREAMQPVTLEFWGVWDNSGDFSQIVESYTALHPNISIRYKKFQFEEYEDFLLNAFAEDQGPDIFTVHNTWVRKYQDKIAPMPSTVQLPFQQVQGTIKEEVVTVLKTSQLYTPREIRSLFADQVEKDCVMTVKENDQNVEKVYGVPQSMDTMVMFYNKDLFNNAGIPLPPSNWTDFQQAVVKLTNLDDDGEILQSGVAMGTAGNISRSFDIVSLLMMQNGVKMTAENSHYATFANPVQGVQVQPVESALNFYTDFANPLKQVYTWNEDMPDALESFISGQTAIMFGYTYNLDDIKSRAPQMNLGIAAMPQIEGNPKTNYASYWVRTVSDKSQHQSEAWDFVKFMSEPDQVKTYLERTNQPTALRSLIEEQKENEELAVFADQVLTAKSWYQGYNAGQAEVIFDDMINSVIAGELPMEDILELAVNRINRTMSNPYDN